jgi:hypothetical protein
MTAATRRRMPKQRLPTERRLGYIYAYDTLRVDRTTGAVLDGSTLIGYVGKTVQKPTARDDQHRGIAPSPNGEPPECQPFSDTIVGPIRVVEQGMWTERELDDRETFWIERLLPVYNWQKNPRSNPNRIAISDARAHRDFRDRARGQLPRQWPAFRNPPKSLPAPITRPVRKPSRLPARWRRRRNWACAWLASTLGLWAVLALLTARVVVQWQVLPIGAAGAVSAAYVFRLKRRRKIAWAILGIVTVVLAALAAH